MQLKKQIINNVELKFRNSEVNVMIPSTIEGKEPYFRAAWVSYIVGDFKASINEEEMKNNLLNVIKYLEMFNMNAIIFHVRTYNNAYYKTQMAPIDENFGTYSSFEKWDYLKWFIDECHSRGIEFHAWLNPYRIKSSGYKEGTTPQDVANNYQDFKVNPASCAENILMTSSNGAILNPAKEVVQKYIIDVCLELIKNYDIDAIHFDDYFYAQMTKDIDVLNEKDQEDYISFIKNNNTTYQENNALDKKNWRRDNVSKFIHDLHLAIEEENVKHNRHIQLGISPTGIYKNGNGSIESGSNTVGQEHYESYLFCDSLLWVEKEWIDYLIPQSYWGFTHPVAGFADVMSWWDKVFENKKTKLYSGMGLYMSYNQLAHSWYNYPYEASDQIMYLSSLKNVSGVSVFAFKHLIEVIENKDSKAYLGLDKIRKELWATKVSCPKVK